MFQSEKRLVSAALNFACFLIDAGWYLHAESVLQRIETIPGYEAEVGLKLLHVFGAYSKFSEAEEMLRLKRKLSDLLAAKKGPGGCKGRGR